LSDIYHLIDRLERLLAESMRLPLSAYLVINEDDFLDVIDQMRTAIPQQIRDGERLQRERERIVAQAEEEAERVVLMARDTAGGLVGEHEVSLAAQAHANAIMENARQEAEVLRAGANDYARAVLGSLDDQLNAVDEQIANRLVTVRNGLDTLTQGSDAGLAVEAAEDPGLVQQG
jgi:cell division septum initiation protein DivIVA